MAAGYINPITAEFGMVLCKPKHLFFYTRPVFMLYNIRRSLMESCCSEIMTLTKAFFFFCSGQDAQVRMYLRSCSPKRFSINNEIVTQYFPLCSQVQSICHIFSFKQVRYDVVPISDWTFSRFLNHCKTCSLRSFKVSAKKNAERIKKFEKMLKKCIIRVAP